MKINKILLIVLILVNAISCKNNINTAKYTSLSGKTMGTTYNIKYKNNINYQSEIDIELKRINNELSTYISTSTISRFNQSETGISIDKNDLLKNIIKAKKIFELSNGTYDPTVMPLVNYWGFGYTEHKKVNKIDSLKIDSIKQYIGFEKISLVHLKIDSIILNKTNKHVQLDLSSIAKGYGVDKIGQLLKSKGINDYLVEIGGEITCQGLSPSNRNWVVGINTPDETASTNEYIVNIALTNKSLATSGNYRNFYDVDGHKYSHTINPKTGYPEKSNLLSATIITKDCMTADALATACMVSGFDWAKNIIEKTDSIKGILIYLDNNKEMKVWQNNRLKQAFQ